MSNDTSPLEGTLETPVTRTIKLVIFSVPLGPSLLCSLYIMICLIYEPRLRLRANHGMLAIIVINFLELICDLVPISLPYLYTGHVRSMSICLYWVTGTYTLQGIAAWLMAWASIDRYLLIFFHRLRSTFLRHDLPLVIIHVFIVSWYIIITLTHPCSENWFDGTAFLCGGPCFNSDPASATADWVFIVLLPALVVVVFNLFLVVSVLFQKYRRRPGFQRRSFSWRQNRKLLVQLLAISFVFLITQIPLVILALVQLFGPPDFLIDISHIWLYYSPYMIYIVTPFAYVATTKQCRKRICGRWLRTNTIRMAPSNRAQVHVPPA